MSTPESTAQFITGMQHLEKAIRAGVRERHGDIPSQAFRWHRGKNFLPPPMVIELEVHVRKNVVKESFSREEIKDSQEGISRPGLKQKIRFIVDALSR